MTATQLELPIAGIVEPTYERTATIQERWEAWEAANPWVVPYIAGLLDDWSEHGGKRVGVKAAVEWARLFYQRRTQGDSWAWNNTYSSRLARDLIERYPHLADVIETRTLQRT